MDRVLHGVGLTNASNGVMRASLNPHFSPAGIADGLVIQKGGAWQQQAVSTTVGRPELYGVDLQKWAHVFVVKAVTILQTRQYNLS